MADNTTQPITVQHSISRFFKVIKLERREIYAIYFYAVLYGLVQLTLPLGIQSIINFVQANVISTSLIVLIIMVVLGVFLSGLLQVNQMKLNERIQQNLFARYTFEFSYRLPKIDMMAIDKYYLPELVNRFFDVVSLQKGLSKLLLDIPVATIQIIFGLILLSFYNSIFILFGMFLIIMLFLVIKVTSRKGFDTSMEESDYKYKVLGWLEEMARTIKSIKYSKGTTLHMEKSDGYLTGYLKARTSHFKVLLTQYWALILFKVLITMGMLVVGGVLLVKNQLNVGQFIAAEIVILSVLTSVEKFIVSLDKVYDVLTSVEKLGKIIDKPIEKSGQLSLDISDGIRINASSVSFGFDEKQVLHNLDFKIKAGSNVCICGNEGSGKSSLLRLLTGAYSQYQGQLLINDLPISNYTLDSLREHTSIFFSQQDIFQGTLWENISMGTSYYNTTEVVDMAKQIGLLNFITSLPNGFDSELDPTGRRLSKATTRKILFLRALVSKPTLLLLEDPWEGLEENSRQQMLLIIKEKLQHATVIIATNNEQYKEECNQVFELQDGRLTILK